MCNYVQFVNYCSQLPLIIYMLIKRINLQYAAWQISAATAFGQFL
jgi:hypothetical protein